VVLHVGPNADGTNARDVTVVAIDSEHGLRNLEWIENTRRKIDRQTQGRVLMSTCRIPQALVSSLHRYFFAQVDKQAVIIDERYNEGGQIADYVIDTLRRVPMSNYDRAKAWTSPTRRVPSSGRRRCSSTSRLDQVAT